MKKYGLISEHVHHVTAYDEDAVPLVYAEFEIAISYYHTLLDGRIKYAKPNYYKYYFLSLLTVETYPDDNSFLNFRKPHSHTNKELAEKD